MRVDEVITRAIVALYATPRLASMLFLKGGSAMRLFDHLESRLSIDADFSVIGKVSDKEKFFNDIEVSLRTGFESSKYEVIDFRSVRKPNTLRSNYPDWWGGLSCEFKLVSRDHMNKTLEVKRRHALIPEGSNSSIVTLDVSEHEYCGKTRSKLIRGVRILGYSRELMVLEKLRAICQQHPDYQYRLSKNRSRDFYDIYELTKDAGDDFAGGCLVHLIHVFEAKAVPLELLAVFWDDIFIDEQRRGFDQVRDTVSGVVQSFDVYVEHVRFLVKEIFPGVLSVNKSIRHKS